MAVVGDKFIFGHKPRSAGRSITRMLRFAGVGEQVGPSIMHESLSEIIERFGSRKVIVGSLREPTSWYLGMATSGVRCHRWWIDPYLKVADMDPPTKRGTLEAWMVGCDWVRLIEFLVDPPDGIEIPEEGDSHIFKQIGSHSLYASNYIYNFLKEEAKTELLSNKIEDHKRFLLLNHMIIKEQVLGGMDELMKLIKHPRLKPIHHREAGVRVDSKVVYSSERGEGLRKRIEERDGPIYKFWADVGSPLVSFKGGRRKAVVSKCGYGKPPKKAKPLQTVRGDTVASMKNNVEIEYLEIAAEDVMKLIDNTRGLVGRALGEGRFEIERVRKNKHSCKTILFCEPHQLPQLSVMVTDVTWMSAALLARCDYMLIISQDDLTIPEGFKVCKIGGDDKVSWVLVQR